jgi:hypothetical protein
MKETFYRYNVPVKICLLADIHDRPFGEIVSSLRRRRPDIIAVAGDIIERVRTDTDKPVILQPRYSLDFLRACAACAPTFFSLGNHEWMLSDKDIKIITESGVTVLDNSFVRFGKLCIGGLTSAGASAYAQFRKNKPQLYPTWNYFNAPQRYEPQTQWLSHFEKQDGYNSASVCMVFFDGIKSDSYNNDVKCTRISFADTLTVSGIGAGSAMKDAEKIFTIINLIIYVIVIIIKIIFINVNILSMKENIV